MPDKDLNHLPVIDGISLTSYKFVVNANREGYALPLNDIFVTKTYETYKLYYKLNSLLGAGCAVPEYAYTELYISLCEIESSVFALDICEWFQLILLSCLEVDLSSLKLIIEERKHL